MRQVALSLAGEVFWCEVGRGRHFYENSLRVDDRHGNMGCYGFI